MKVVVYGGVASGMTTLAWQISHDNGLVGDSAVIEVRNLEDGQSAAQMADCVVTLHARDANNARERMEMFGMTSQGVLFVPAPLMLERIRKMVRPHST